MNVDLWVTLGVLVGTVVLFVTERFPVALVALMALSALTLSGVVSPEDALAGLSNPATVTVAGIFVISAGIRRSGVLEASASALSSVLRRHHRLGMVLLMGSCAVASAFVNNTAVVVVMMPLVVAAGRSAGVSVSKLLIPLSFASMLGGTCTLVGTSTNLLVDAMAREQGLPPLGMFELAPVGLLLTLVGGVYIAIAGPWILPGHREDRTAIEEYEIRDYLMDIRVPDDPQWAGHRIADAPVPGKLDCDVLTLLGPNRKHVLPSDNTELHAGDILRLRCGLADVATLVARSDVEVVTESLEGVEFDDDDAVFAEAVVTPQSALDGRLVSDARLRERHGAVLLAIRQRGGELRRSLMSRARIVGGDVLLLRIPRAQLTRLHGSDDFVVVTKAKVEAPRRHKIPFAVGILVAVILSASMGWVSVDTAAVAGAIATVLCGCLRFGEAVAAIRMHIVLLLVGLLALAHAMESSGAAELAAHGVTALVRDAGGIHALVAAIYVVTVVLTSVVSNNGTAAVMTPIAIGMAAEAGIDSRPLVMAVAFAASSSFLTPMGYQTNTLVYNAGHYRFGDFVRMGGPLTLTVLVVAVFVIPLVWPG